MKKLILLFSLVLLPSSAQVAASYFGIAVSKNAGVILPSASNPPLMAGTIRLHDSGCDWSDIETSNGVYDWTCIDGWLSQVHGQKVIWTLSKVPPFHATDSTALCAELTGSCSPPSDVAVDGSGTDAAWQAFITAATAHLTTAGTLSKVTYVEPWNESNNSASGSAWWIGTASQSVRMAYDLRTIWKAANSSVTIMTPSTCACLNTSFTRGALVVSTTATFSSGSPNVTLASGTSTANGQVVYGPGIPGNTTISSGGGTTSIVLSQNTTAPETGSAISFFAAATYTTTNPQDGMHYYLSATANVAGTPAGGAQADMVDVHTYVGASAPETVGSGYIAGTFSAMTATGYGALPLAITEMGWALNTSASLDGGACAASPPFTQSCLDNMGAWVARVLAVAASRSIVIFAWYAWGNNTHGTLYDKGNPPFLLEGATAFNQMAQWLTGATRSSNCSNASTVWTCAFTNGSESLLLVWDTSQTCAPCTTSTYSVPGGYTTQYDLAGDAPVTLGATTQIGLKPVLLTNESCSITSPTAAQLIQTVTSLPLTVSCTNAPSSGWGVANNGIWQIDYRRWARAFTVDQHQTPVAPEEAWTGVPLGATWYSGLRGDGPHTASVVVYDIAGNQIATASQAFTVRLSGMSNICFNILPPSSTIGACKTAPYTASGTGRIGVLKWLAPGAHGMIDGLDLSTGTFELDPLYQPCGFSLGSSQTSGFFNPAVTSCFPNGQRLLTYGAWPYNLAAANDPYVITQNFTLGGGNNITLGNHNFQNGDVVTFSNTGGALPTGLTTGYSFYWGTSAAWSGATATIAWSGGTGTVTCSAACNATTMTPVYIQGIPYTNQQTAVNGCDGVYTPASGSGSSFTFTASSTCPNGTITAQTNTNPVTITFSGVIPANGDTITISGYTGTSCFDNQEWQCVNGTHQVKQVSGSIFSISGINTTSTGAATGSPIYQPPNQAGTKSLEVDVNPFFIQYVDANDITVSATCTAWDHNMCSAFGSTVAVSGGSGTQTAQTRIQSHYWGQFGGNGYIPVSWIEMPGVAANLTQYVNFNNTANTPMAIQIPSKEYHGITGKSTDTLCPQGILTTDNPPVLLTLASLGLTCSSFSYYYRDDGVITGQMSVSSTGVITYNNTSSWVNSQGQSATEAWGIVDVYDNTGTALPAQTVTTTGTASMGSTALTVANGGAGIGNSSTVYVSGAGIQLGTTVVSGGGGANLVLSLPTTAPLSTTPVVFTSAVRAYIEHHGDTAVTFRHFTDCGVVAISFNGVGGCPSRFMLGLYQAGISGGATPSFQGPQMVRSNLNTVTLSYTYNNNLIDPTATSCQAFPGSDGNLANAQTFLTAFPSVKLEYDLYPIWFFLGNTSASLAAILGNPQTPNGIGFNRRTCLQNLVTYLQSLGVRRFFNGDEVSDQIGTYLSPNPAIGGVNWTSATTAGGVLTLNVTNQNEMTAWVQSTGRGDVIQITGATTNSCINGWHLVSTVNSTTITTPAGSCGNGLTINAASDSMAQIASPFPGLSVSDSNCSDPNCLLLRNAGPILSDLNLGSGTTNLPVTCETWSGHGLGGNICGHAGGLNSITCTGSNPTTCTVSWTGNLIPATNTPLVRIYGATTANLNTAQVPTSVSTNSFVLTYDGSTGKAQPANGTYNVSSDSTLYFTVDPNWGMNPLGTFMNLVKGFTNSPTIAFSPLGSLFFNQSQTYSFATNPLSGLTSSFLYFPDSPPSNYTGDDVSGNQWLTYPYIGGGLVNRAFTTQPRAALFNGGWLGGGNVAQYCRSTIFNPACDKPAQLLWQPEDFLEQFISMKALQVSAFRMYNYNQQQQLIYQSLGIGAQSGTGRNGKGGTGSGGAMSANDSPKAWSGLAHADALLVLGTDTGLQPETDKPYMGPFFVTDAHLSSTYGNETTVISGSDSPIGARTVPLNQIASGSTILRTSDGYSTQVSLVANNPSSITQEWAPSPGYTWEYVSLPPGYTPITMQNFTPPTTLPFSSTNMYVRVGYYPDDMRSDPVTFCTFGCTIPIDAHNINLWYQLIFDKGPQNPVPVMLPSQGLP